MRYFERLALYPAIQAQLSSKTTTVFVLSKKQRKEIVNQLMTAQKSLCCYCECRILVKDPDSGNKGYHIDHFEEQHDELIRIFDYTNMLLACESNTTSATKSDTEAKNITSCGHHKTRDRHNGVEIDYKLLLNPTNNVSSLFSYRDGVVEASKICTTEQVKQVEYTINRLNLDAHRLENARIDELDEIHQQLDGLTEDKQKAFIRSLLDETQPILNPYFSTIKDSLGFLLL